MTYLFVIKTHPLVLNLTNHGYVTASYRIKLKTWPKLWIKWLVGFVGVTWMMTSIISRPLRCRRYIFLFKNSARCGLAMFLFIIFVYIYYMLYYFIEIIKKTKQSHYKHIHSHPNRRPVVCWKKKHFWQDLIMESEFYF